MPRHKHLSAPGQRIIRSVIAVWLCFFVYFLRGRNGIPFFSAIAVLQCIQPYTKDIRKIARQKIVGTLFGSLWGLLLLLLENLLVADGIPDEWPHYLLIGLFTGVVLYDTKRLEYLRTKPMSDGDAARIIHWLRSEKLPSKRTCWSSTIRSCPTRPCGRSTRESAAPRTATT